MASQLHAVEFNAAFLDVNNDTKTSLTKFEHAGYVSPGDYLVDIIFNGRFLVQRQISFVTRADGSSSMPCVPREVVDDFGLKADPLKAVLASGQTQCLDPTVLEGARVTYKQADARLSIVVPQSFVEYHDDRFVPAERASDGVPGLLLDYRLSATTRHTNSASNTDDSTASSSVTTYGTLGYNVGAWRGRLDYQLDTSAGSGQRGLQINRLYAYRAIPSLKGTLSLGQQYLQSDLYDTVSFLGASLVSDDRMLPPSLRGYAPHITGIARTNAKVTISQNGNILYSQTVPPGAFDIQDLSSTVQGMLDVTVEEQDGSTQKFNVATASVPFLSREGAVRYRAAIGQPYRAAHELDSDVYGIGEASYGIADTWSVYGGSILGPRYQAGTLGLGKDLGDLGAVSFDVTQMKTTMPIAGGSNQDQTRSGRSYSFNYSKRFDDLNADLRFFGYRFSDRNYVSFSNFVAPPGTSGEIQSDKQRFSVVGAKRFGDISSYLTLSSYSYWNQPTSQRADLNLSRTMRIGSLRNVSVGLSGYYSRDASGNSVGGFINFNVPLDQQQLGYTLQSVDGKVSQTANWNLADNRNNYQLSMGMSGRDPSLSGYASHNTDGYKASVYGASVNNQYSSLSANLDGSLVLTQEGPVAHTGSYNGNTRLVVTTDGVPDVPIGNGKRSTDGQGVAVIDGMAPYERMEARIDVNNLPPNAEVTSPIQQVVLSDGAIGVARFVMRKGYKLLAELKTSDGQALPLGTVINEPASGREIGIVGERGIAYLSGLRSISQLIASWDGGAQCYFSLPDEPANQDKTSSTLDQIVQITCSDTKVTPQPSVANKD